jgi:hypothetical protein
MLKQILELLRYTEVDKGELIAIAKGKNQFPKNWKQIKQHAKWLSQK